MKSDLKKKLILECLKDKDDFLHLKGSIERFPYKLIKNGTWNKEIFNEEWFVKYKDHYILNEEEIKCLKDFDNAPNNRAKVEMFIMIYLAYLNENFESNVAMEFFDL